VTASREDVRKKEWRDRAALAARSAPIPIRCTICPAGPGKPCVNSVTLERRDRPHITRVLAAERKEKP